MALKPSISLSLGNKCDKVTFTETTGVYNATTNVTGWGTPNIDTTDIATSVVNIYNYTGTTLLDTFDLTGLYPSATPSEFNILEEEDWTLADGIYKIMYTITDDSVTPVVYNNDLTHELFLCNLCNCKNGLIEKLVKSCDTETVKKLKLQVDQMEIFVYGIQSAFSCGDFITATTILTAASAYCQTLSDCGCGCGGC